MHSSIKSSEQKKYFFPKIILAYCFIGILLNSCSDSEKFYDKLATQPEIVSDFKEVYSIGDTLVLRGRLNPENGLKINIGGTDALPLDISKEEVQNNQNGLILDVIKVLITQEMGIGEHRPVLLTSAGITISASDIEIVGDANAAIFDTPMQLVKIADIPDGATPVYCRSGNGNVYVFSSTSKKLFKIEATTGNVTEAFSESACIDNNGAFTIEEFNAGAVSPDERYFYFSAKVKESGQSRTLELYKLCRYDLQSDVLFILNRTEYSMLQSRRTPESVLPFVGKVDEVKIYKITALYPDSEGNIYCNLMGRFITLLDKNLNYSYRLSITADQSTAPVNEGSFIPLINNSETNTYYSLVQIHQLFPGSKIRYNISYMDTETRQLYSKKLGGITSLRVIDVATQILMAEYTNNIKSSEDVAYVTASLKRFNGGLVNNSGFDPLPVNGKLYGIFFTDSASETYGLPAACVIDLDNQNAKRLAPGRLLYNNFSIAEYSDRLLNYEIDEQGRIVLYLTANNKKVVVKTAFINSI